MKRRLNIFAGDAALWVIFLLLSGISLIAVYSTIGMMAVTTYSTSPTAQFFRHLVFVLATYVVVIILSHTNYRIYAKLSKWALLLAVALLAVLLAGGGRRMNLVVASFQPSEIAKVAVVVFLARSLAHNKETLNENRTLLAVSAPVLVVAGLVLPSNLSMSIIILVTCFFMLFYGGMESKRWWKWFAILSVVAAGGFVFLYNFGDQVDWARSSTWGHRLQNWLNPDPSELTQENIARMAVARGGLFGTGIGTTIHGRLATQAYNDFIFSFIIEEKGLIAAIFIFSLYALFFFRCIRIASHCKGTFGGMCVAGIGTLVLVQALINMSVAVSLLPVTGQPLPFISYGGSAYLCMGCGLGIIQAVAADNKKQTRIARQAERTADPEKGETPETDSQNKQQTNEKS